MSILKMFKVHDFYQREGKINIESFFNKHSYFNILLMNPLKLTICDFYDKMDGIKYKGQYDIYRVAYARGVIFK